MSRSWVLIIDYGSQVTQLIARRVRECSIYAEVVPYQKADDALSAPNAASLGAVILSGGPDSVLRDGSPDLPKAFDDSGASVGNLLWPTAVNEELWRQHRRGRKSRIWPRDLFGFSSRITLFPTAWKEGGEAQVWMSHGDHVQSIPDDYDVIGVSDGAPYAALAHKTRPIYAVQFHPEISHTDQGDELIRNFVCGVAAIEPNGRWGHFALKPSSKFVPKSGIVA